MLGYCGNEGPAPAGRGWSRGGRGREAQAHELERGRGKQRAIWKVACFGASEVIGRERGSKMEAALYAIMCSNAQRVLPVCSSWEVRF